MDLTEDCMNKYKALKDKLSHIEGLSFGIDSCVFDAAAQARFTTSEHVCTIHYFATAEEIAEVYAAATIELRDLRKGYHLRTQDFEDFEQACKAYEGLHLFYRL